ncbi:MAG: CRTAC1 family protein [Bryobacterales bacterium]|nr:CRTAC1 family protein [Bryobacterales bacterium]
MIFAWFILLLAADLPIQFIDVARSAGLNSQNVFGGIAEKKYILETTGSGVALIDYDGDGWTDIFLVNGTTFNPTTGAQPTNHLYRNLKNGEFEDVTAAAGLIRTGWGQGVCTGDYDNDGAIDLFVTYWGQNVLYRNSGKGTFEDATERAGLRQRQTRWGSGCAFLDYDRDGQLDLFVSNYIQFDLATASLPGTQPFCQFLGLAVNCGPRGLKGESNVLYRNNGNGIFSDRSEASGVAKVRGNFGLGVLTGDFDNDGWTDIYVANDTNASLLFRNNHDGSFEEVGVFAGVAYNSEGKETSGMGVTAADYNADGWLDIFKTNFSDESASLYRGTGDGLFVEESELAGVGRNKKWVGWGCGFADFDNDGWPDLFVVNGHVYPELDRANRGVSFRQPRIVYRNLGTGRFADVSAAAGPAITNPASGRGVAFGDLDNDGAIEAVVNNMNDYPALLKLIARTDDHWITVQTVGVKSNRSGIGARVVCVTGKHRQMNEVRSGGSHFSQSDLRLHFGVGSNQRVDRIEIHWPSGIVDQLRDIPVDRVLRVEEGSSRLVRKP